MVKESARKCSHCGHNGHNSRTCNGKVCFRLFGVRIETDKEDEFMRKSKSMGNLVICNAEHSGVVVEDGYLSDGLIQQSDKAKAAHERKKGVPWNEDEHRLFLLGLERLGKGDWRGISKNYVPTRTPTQVASHAQKYFIRMGSTTEKKKRRSSLFDMSFKESLALHLPVSPGTQSKTTAEASQQGSSSPVSLQKNTVETQAQASTSAQVAKPQEAAGVLPMAATFGVPDFRHMPYMVGVPSSGQSFPAAKAMQTISFVQVMSYPNQSYIYLPKAHGNFTTCAPFAPPMPSAMLPQLLPHGPSQAGSES